MTTQALPFLDEAPNADGPDGHWMRSGSCDQCASGETRGECCTKVAFPITPSAGHNPDIVRYFQLHGIEVKWWGSLPLAFVPLRCEALEPNGDCALYGSPERPSICGEGPFNPWAAQAFSHCSYTFEFEREK